MKQHLRRTIAELQQQGYTQDFVLYGNDLFWAQEKTMIREQEFSVEQYHRLYSPDGATDYVVLGILSIDKAAKGILLTPYNYVEKTPNLVFKKLRAFAESAIGCYTQ